VFHSTPLPQQDHALAAVRSAYAMQRAANALKTQGVEIGFPHWR
jgi:hypothetical protein